MAFEFEVRFEGLCHFIQNRNPQEAVGMCVVLPDATDHVAKIELVSGSWINRTTQSRDPTITLQRQRVDFKLSGGDAGSQFNFVKKTGDIQAVIDLAQIVGRIARNDPLIVAETNVSQAVRAQILLREGSLKPYTAATWDWTLKKNPFKQDDEPVTVAFKTIWRFDSIETVELHLRPFGGSPEIYDITPEDDLVSLEISNECTREDAPRVDEDFEFHYTLLHPDSRAERDRLDTDERRATLPERRTILVDVPRRLVNDIRARIGGPIGIPEIDALAGLDMATSSQVATASLGVGEESLTGIQEATGLSRVELRRLEQDLARFRAKLFSGGGTGTGCNCLGCNGEKLDLPEFSPPV